MEWQISRRAWPIVRATFSQSPVTVIVLFIVNVLSWIKAAIENYQFGIEARIWLQGHVWDWIWPAMSLLFTWQFWLILTTLILLGMVANYCILWAEKDRTDYAKLQEAVLEAINRHPFVRRSEDAYRVLLNQQRLDAINKIISVSYLNPLPIENIGTNTGTEVSDKLRQLYYLHREYAWIAEYEIGTLQEAIELMLRHNHIHNDIPARDMTENVHRLNIQISAIKGYFEQAAEKVRPYTRLNLSGNQ